MSRVTSSDTVEVKPTNNIYTVLVGIAILVQLIGFIVLVLRAGAIFVQGKSLFS